MALAKLSRGTWSTSLLHGNSSKPGAVLEVGSAWLCLEKNRSLPEEELTP